MLSGETRDALCLFEPGCHGAPQRRVVIVVFRHYGGRVEVSGHGAAVVHRRAVNVAESHVAAQLHLRRAGAAARDAAGILVADAHHAPVEAVGDDAAGLPVAHDAAATLLHSLGARAVERVQLDAARVDAVGYGAVIQAAGDAACVAVIAVYRAGVLAVGNRQRGAARGAAVAHDAAGVVGIGAHRAGR